MELWNIEVLHMCDMTGGYVWWDNGMSTKSMEGGRPHKGGREKRTEEKNASPM